LRRTQARALVVRLAPGVGERGLKVVREKLGWEGAQLSLETSADALSPNFVLTLEVESGQLTEVFTGVGERGVRAETIAERACAEAARYLAVGAPVGEHLADQLLIPLALSGGGSYLTGPPTPHTTTNIEVVKMFLPVEITTTHLEGELWKVEVCA
jgi:RNA 3'-terminal phosphate cyclase (ATP)